VPVLVKGVTTVDAAKAALQQNVQGIIVSNDGGLAAPRGDALVLQLPAIVDAVAGKVPVLVDGSFRRGTDLLQALALVIEMLQTELARYVAMCGKSNVKMLGRDVVHVHAAAVPARPLSE
jgi:isopentenyl diphosphate isomerase/L-lactate dehydrogenase-like FMN-dependent dehydrogenase